MPPVHSCHHAAVVYMIGGLPVSAAVRAVNAAIQAIIRRTLSP